MGKALIPLRRLEQVVRRRGQGDRISSYPFVSGDTFRSACDLSIDDLEDFREAPADDLGNSRIVFAEVEQIPQLDGVLSRSGLACQDTRLVIHNGDIVDHERVAALAATFRRVYCVNWLGSQDIAEPIPIGLENNYININGRVKDFEPCLPMNRRRILSLERPISVLSTFDPRTNLGVRYPLSIIARKHPCVTSPRYRLTPKSHRHALLQSLFVLSPPGNGPDCHRTWEAMYHGAVPIVWEKAWPFRHLSLPVLTTSSWQEALELVAQDPLKLWMEVVHRQHPALWFEFYAMRLRTP